MNGLRKEFQNGKQRSTTSLDQGAGTELSSLSSRLLSTRWCGGRPAVSSMSAQNGFAASLPRPSVQTIAGMALRQATWRAILAALLFLPAGRWNWPEAWAVLVAYGAFLVLSGVWWHPWQRDAESECGRRRHCRCARMDLASALPRASRSNRHPRSPGLARSQPIVGRVSAPGSVHAVRLGRRLSDDPGIARPTRPSSAGPDG